MTINSLPILNFPPIKLRTKHSDAASVVWDGVRRCYICLTPEEWVRQHLVSFLASSFLIDPTRMALEYPVLLNGQHQRADLVVMGRGGEAVILAECKAADVAISQHTLDQAVRYNSVVRARYVILTNGIDHYLYERGAREGEYTPLSDFRQLEL